MPAWDIIEDFAKGANKARQVCKLQIDLDIVTEGVVVRVARVLSGNILRNGSIVSFAELRADPKAAEVALMRLVVEMGRDQPYSSS